MKNKKAFYKTTWFMWVMLIFFAPVGIALLWIYHKEYSQNVKIVLSAIFAIFFVVVMITGNTSNKTVETGNIQKVETTTLPTSEPTIEPVKEEPKIEVSLDASVDKNDGKPIFTIKTNLPDETNLMLTLSNDDYKGQTSVIVKNGIATSEPYSANGNNLSSGKYVLSVSMSEPRLQSNNVRAIVGETGENMIGKYVQTSDIDNTKFISGNFKFSLKLKKEKIVEKYDNEIVVCCKMFLDNFIANYDVSLAPQMWTLVKFDKKGAIIAITDVTFDFMSEVQKAMIVFTPNIDDGKMLGGTPHYIAVGDTVYGDDGYCDKLFSKLKKFINNQ